MKISVTFSKFLKRRKFVNLDLPMCEPGAIEWIEDVFQQCVVTKTDKWSFAIGLLSSLIWVVSSTPQIYQNWSTKSVEGVSPFLFSLILLGDILSFVGLLVNGGLLTQYITSIIFVVLDGTCYLQFIYYKHFPGKPKASEVEELNETSNRNIGAVATLVGAAAAFDAGVPYRGKDLWGTLFGWVGSIIYITSRIPQIRKNVEDRLVKDLNVIFVLFSFLGNLTYFLSLLIKSLELQFLWNQLPWIAGAVGPMLCDFILMVQMCVYGLEKGEKTIEASHIEEEDTENEGRVLNEL